ncbi:hypothetical protein [Pantoea sp. At-9b]|jgi:hypothetical protein|uniref:hypothetical protein n=1 Tax=Pantoea sp. (strain At-9b) TaxID=592316 RepID=UPI0001B3EE15|nr:hypothetical protein [Pantoea sp. At-9b]ADU72006.1 hypothetical protein Pat9b_5850 [Pantoea sp. At-9b]
MQTWVVMMGCEFLLFALAAIMVIIWMRRPDDHLDEMLKKIEMQNSSDSRNGS